MVELKAPSGRDILFQPTQLGALRLANKMVMAPMTRSRASRDGVPSPWAAEYYAQRASAGLIITEGTQPSYEGQGYSRTPGIHTAMQVAGWRAVTDAVHRAGGKIALQMMHVGRVGHPLNQWEPVGLVAPSPIAAQGQIYTDQSGQQPMATPRAMSLEDVKRVIDEHKKAAALALEAGFDGVELHGANGYLLQQFLAANSNQRTDDYGGSPERRTRFVLELVDAVAAEIGPERLGLRISPGGGLNDLREEDTETTYRTLLQGLGDLAWVHFMHTGWPQDTLYRWVRSPMILTGGYDADTGAAALGASATAVGFGRAFLANPDLPRRFREGAPLNEPRPQFFFSPGAEGYLDYPSL